MSFATALVLAFSLSMDAFAAALGKGAALRHPGLFEALRIGAYFGFLELAMPLVGFTLGLAFSTYVADFDHWVAFILLVGIGGKMAWESLHDRDDDADEAEIGGAARRGRPGMATLILTALGTSVDASAVGVTLSVMDVEIFGVCLLIGTVTFTMTSGAVLIGRAAGPLIGRRAELLGGLGLMAIGTKILVEHTLF